MRTDPTPAGRLVGRTAIVTGASRGIGAAIAAALHAEGARLALLDVSVDVKAVADTLDAAAVQVDLSDPPATIDAMHRALAALGGMADVLVNNAGILRMAPLLEITVADWDLTFAVNTRAMLLTTQVAGRAMAAAGRGAIVNIASMGGKDGGVEQAHYAASKAAVIALTQVTAKELGPHGVRANAICPGFVLTEMGAETRTPEMVAAWTAKSPLGRLGTPEDVARMAVFLASDDASYCTGQAFNVTGGMITH
jgi:NAD(P)-dependent dehydrogenase (short-subunit alcohol dehydrogenase family)